MCHPMTVVYTFLLLMNNSHICSSSVTTPTNLSRLTTPVTTLSMPFGRAGEWIPHFPNHEQPHTTTAHFCRCFVMKYCKLQHTHSDPTFSQPIIQYYLIDHLYQKPPRRVAIVAMPTCPDHRTLTHLQYCHVNYLRCYIITELSWQYSPKVMILWTPIE